MRLTCRQLRQQLAVVDEDELTHGSMFREDGSRSAASFEPLDLLGSIGRSRY
jgi:hypothetical protein